MRARRARRSTDLIQFAPRLEGDAHRSPGRATLEDETLIAVVLEFDELALTGIVADCHAGYRSRFPASFAARNPPSRSARMSSIDSMPIESRTRSALTPVESCSSGGEW